MKKDFSKTAFFTLFTLFIFSDGLSAEENIKVDNALLTENDSSYPASFFDQYTPQNAMEMIMRLPGFFFDAGSSNRGFGGNAGNVLIDGVRPTSKSGGLEDALQRIPASQVLYIEVLRGGISAGEAAGQAIVANVVKKDTTTSGTWGVSAIRAANGVIKPQAEASVAIKLGKWDTSFDTKLGAQPEYRDVDIQYFDNNDEQIYNTDETRDSVKQEISFNGEGARELAGGTLTINTALSSDYFQGENERNKFSTLNMSSTGSDEYWLLDEEEKNHNTELGVDWVKKTVDDWKLRIIALTSSQDLHYENVEYSEFKNLANTYTSHYTQDTVEKEHIARITYGKIGETPFKPEFGVEIANNQLNSEVSLLENGVPKELEGADTVEEIRGEMFVNFVYTPNSLLTLEGGLTAEFSEIKAYSDEVKSQRYNFVKPRFSASYSLSDSSTLTLVAEHTVDQLDFNDFAASSDSIDGRETSGNDTLQPEQATSFYTIYDWRYSERGSLNIEAVIERRQDVHEQIILPSGNQGLGNAGDADFWFINANLSLPLDVILENGLLDIFYTYKDSSFYDPIISDYRTIYDYKPSDLYIEFRQDLLRYNFSWGFEYIHHYEKTKYYVDEIQKNSGNNFLKTLFFETTKFFDSKIRLDIKDSNGTLFTRSRYFYQDDRSGAYKGAEVTYITRDPEIELSFTGTF